MNGKYVTDQPSFIFPNGTELYHNDNEEVVRIVYGGYMEINVSRLYKFNLPPRIRFINKEFEFDSTRVIYDVLPYDIYYNLYSIQTSDKVDEFIGNGNYILKVCCFANYMGEYNIEINDIVTTIRYGNDNTRIYGKVTVKTVISCLKGYNGVISSETKSSKGVTIWDVFGVMLYKC
jgi:hypothetical protein